MKLIRGLLLAVLVLAALFIVIGLFLPRTVHVERSTVIDAPPCTVFALVNSFRRFNEWSPWAALDPNAKYVSSGPSQGVGAKMSWASSDRQVGSGSQTIVTSQPFKLVETKLDFGRQGNASGFYRIAAEDNGTKLTWGFDTDLGSNVVARYFGLMMDSMAGKDFEKGLAKLKGLVEALPKGDWSDLKIELVTTESKTIVSVTGHAGPDPAQISRAFSAAFTKVMRYVGRNRLEMAGPALAITTSWDDGGYGFTAGVPIAGSRVPKIRPGSPIEIHKTYAGEAVKAVHVGPYSEMHPTYEKIISYMAAYGLEANGNSWEEYVSDPIRTPENELVTNVFFPVK